MIALSVQICRFARWPIDQRIHFLDRRTLIRRIVNQARSLAACCHEAIQRQVADDCDEPSTDCRDPHLQLLLITLAVQLIRSRKYDCTNQALDRPTIFAHKTIGKVVQQIGCVGRAP